MGTILLWAFATLAGLSVAKKVALFARPDLQEVIEEYYSFREWLRERRRRYKAGA
jgi:hypothetical protein